MTLQELQALYAKRKQLIEDSRKLLDAVDAEKREITPEETERHSRMHDDVSKLTDKIQTEERQRESELKLAERAMNDAEKRGESEGKAESRVEMIVGAARSYLLTGTVDREFAEEWRALQAGSDTAGGYLVMPEMFLNELIEAVRDNVIVRRLGRVFSVAKAVSLGVPSLDSRPDDADWTTELSTGSEDSTMAFGKRALHPHPLAKRIKISEQLVMQSIMPIEAMIRDQLAYKFGITEDKAFLTGNGANQPLGVFTASAQGISTGRDVSTDNTTTSMTIDGLKNAKYSLKSQYQNSPSTSWIFHRDGVKQLAKLKDANGRYLWEDSIKVGEPDRLLNTRVEQSEYAPNTFTTGLYVGIIGDFRNYWIADALDYRIKRLNELYAETDQLGFIARKSTDGMPTLEEAFARVKLA